MTDYKPSFRAARMYRKTSERSGATYFVGRLGGVKVALVKSDETAEDGGEVWSLLFSEAAPFKGSNQQQGQAKAKAQRRGDNEGDGAIDSQAPFPNSG